MHYTYVTLTLQEHFFMRAGSIYVLSTSGVMMTECLAALGKMSLFLILVCIYMMINIYKVNLECTTT